jgi:hypothetical protein
MITNARAKWFQVFSPIIANKDTDKTEFWSADIGNAF